MASAAAVLVSSDNYLATTAEMTLSSSAQMTIGTSTTTTTTIAQAQVDDDHDQVCRACRLPNTLHTDWAQGDRVCTQCGVVDEQHILDDTPEWKDFNEVEDIVRGNPAGRARSGLVPTDETKYWGGLQPTSISKYCFGGNNAHRQTRKRLLVAHHRIEKHMERNHSKLLRTARLEEAIRRKQRLQQKMEDDANRAVETEEVVTQRDEEEERHVMLLSSEKWSLSRAVRLFGAAHERRLEGINDRQLQQQQQDEASQDEDIRKKLDEALTQSAQDLYNAYFILNAAAQRLHLPDRVTREATEMICRYAKSRDGLSVRGIASTLQRKKSRQQTNPRAERAAKQALREYNKLKQTGALSAALLFWVARNQKHPRSLAEVCQSVKPTAGLADNPHLDLGKDQIFIKRKHCSRAMAEIKETFPDFNVLGEGAAESYNEEPTTVAITNFVEHTLRKLSLPPVAEASIRCLVMHWHNQLKTFGNTVTGESSKKPSTKELLTACGALAYFVCSAGFTMQRLASQSQKLSGADTFKAQLRKHIKLEPGIESDSKQKKETVKSSNTASAMTPPAKRMKLEPEIENDSGQEVEMAKQDVMCTKEETHSSEDSISGDSTSDSPEASKSDDSVFDVSITDSAWKKFSAEQRAYEIQKMWDAWIEQLPWSRSLAEVEKCCGISQNVIGEYYRKHVHPNCQSLLAQLQDAVGSNGRLSQAEFGTDDSSGVLRETPLSSILLSHVTSAAPLMKAPRK